MPKFVFQLEGVLRQRRNTEQQRQREMASAQSRMNALERELRDLDETARMATADIRRNHLVGRLDLSYLAGHRRHMLSMQRQALAVMQKLSLAQRQVEEARRNLTEAARQRKVIEKLREKHHQRWLSALARRELSEQDEISMQLSYYAEQESPSWREAMEEAESMT